MSLCCLAMSILTVLVFHRIVQGVLDGNLYVSSRGFCPGRLSTCVARMYGVHGEVTKVKSQAYQERIKPRLHSRFVVGGSRDLRYI